MIAKWPAACVRCPRPIEPGQLIFKASEGGVVHASCDQSIPDVLPEDWCPACWSPIGDCECRVRRVAS